MSEKNADNSSARRFTANLGTLVLGILLLRGCVLDEVDRRMGRIYNAIERGYAPQVQRSHVLGDRTKIEEFYYVNGERAYTEIDGKQIETLYPPK